MSTPGKQTESKAESKAEESELVDGFDDLEPKLVVKGVTGGLTSGFAGEGKMRSVGEASQKEDLLSDGNIRGGIVHGDGSCGRGGRK